MSTSRLDSLRDDLTARRTHAFLVVRNERIVYEWYATGYGRTKQHATASLAKALVGGVSLAVALSDGRIALDDKASVHVPRWAGDPLKSQITIRQLGSHTSGIEDAFDQAATDAGLSQSNYPGWKGEFWRNRNNPQSWVIARDSAPVIFTPGTKFHYSNPGMAMLSYCVTASLKGTARTDIRTLLRDRVMRPMGVPDGEWICGYGATPVVDGLPLVANGGGAGCSPDALARVGLLMLRKGNWHGKQLISPSAVKAITADAGTPGDAAQGWWTNSEGKAGIAPADAFYGAGAGHQIVFVVPSLNLIAVRNGEAMDSSLDFDRALRQFFLDPLIRAVIRSAPRASAQ